MENWLKSRNRSIDLLKGIAALLVCYQHACGEGTAGYLLAVSRIAVPLFVMTTAFLYSDTVNRGKKGKQIFRFAKIAGGMVVFYFAVDFVFRFMQHDAVDYLKSLVAPDALINFFVFNDPIPGDHSWYMWAMVYVLIIMCLAPAIYKNRVVRNIIIAFSVILQVAISKYYFIFTEQEPSALLYRNFLIPVIGYFCIGISIREKSFERFSTGSLSALLLISIMLLFAEKIILQLLGRDRSSGTFLMTPFVAVILFILMLKLNPAGGIGKIIAEFGRKYSLLFYIIHPLFVKFEMRLFDMYGWQRIIGIIFVYALSIAASIICVNTFAKIKTKLRK